MKATNKRVCQCCNIGRYFEYQADWMMAFYLLNSGSLEDGEFEELTAPINRAIADTNRSDDWRAMADYLKEKYNESPT